MLLKRCKILLENGEIAIRDILIESGKIKKISEKIEENGVESIDVAEKIVLPGVIDVHTHMREPGLISKEDFETGSMACVKGGVTTFIDMPNTIPNTITEQSLNEKFDLIKGRSYCDYGFHFGGNRADNSKEIERVKDRVASTKIFLNMSTGDMLVEDEKILENLFNSSRIVSVHAEGELIGRAIELSKKFKKPLYLCHISKAKELELIREAKREGLEIYAEVTPHHLFLSEDMVEDNLLRMKPELKNKEECEALWEGIADGTVDTIGTDHAPHRIEEKEQKLIFGVPSIENSLEMMLKGVKSGKIDLKRLIEVMTINPAKIFGIEGKKGLRVGGDADLVVIDMENEYKISREQIISRSGWSPYEDIITGGKVVTTFVRGEIVYNNGEFLKKIGKGVSYSE